jgi:hypothetical protein
VPLPEQVRAQARVAAAAAVNGVGGWIHRQGALAAAG